MTLDKIAFVEDEQGLQESSRCAMQLTRMHTCINRSPAMHALHVTN